MDTLPFVDAFAQTKKMVAELVAQAETYDEVRAATYLMGQFSMTQLQLQDGYNRY